MKNFLKEAGEFLLGVFVVALIMFPLAQAYQAFARPWVEDMIGSYGGPMSADEVKELAEEVGYSHIKDIDDGVYLMDYDGFMAVLAVRDEKIILASHFKGIPGVGLEEVNNWNRSKPYSVAYLDEDQDVVLESSFYLHEDLTADQVRHCLLLHFAAMFVFAKERVSGEGEVLQQWFEKQSKFELPSVEI